MKVLGFVGSPREEGNTATLVAQVLSGAATKGAETKLYNLATLSIKGCQACNKCKTTGSCATQDDMQELYRAIQEADAVVIGSPVYMYQMSGQTKAFVDRLYAFITPGFTSKVKKDLPAALVFTQGLPDSEKFTAYFENTTRVLEFLGFKVAGVLVAGGTNAVGDVQKQEAVMAKAVALGRDLV
ncbi:MAG: flavodoxin family protein, partial [Heliobacteriaceae bacterium]|nr:flavodoxin family protein [Heliobacteriaceae bacterium]MDD4587924.1 flavodoxin family protein [Heliobacteriaceae bacterium]